jgi:6-phosphofructokinase 1
MKKIAILTSGANASGMNFIIRSVTNYAYHKSFEVLGFCDGFKGLMDNNFIKLNTLDVDDIIDIGGTILHTTRTSEFKTADGIDKAIFNLNKHNLDGLILIGGDGTFRGGYELHNRGIKVIGIPASIYNDIAGTDYSVGFDTALNVIVDSVSRIRDTASSHCRTFIVEVMGRNSGNIALNAGLACAVDYILIPEISFDLFEIVKKLRKKHNKNKSIIIMVAEGAAKAHEVAASIYMLTGQEVRISVIGYMQRGGAPSNLDRLLASRFSKKAVDLLIEGKSCLMTAIKDQEIIAVPFGNIISTKKNINMGLYELAHILAMNR